MTLSHSKTRLNKLRALPALMLAGSLLTGSMLLVSTQAFASGAPAGPFVGEVSLVLGKAWIETAGAGRERVTVGTRVHVNDKIHTAGSGHVHVRFVDDALVSVRPDSLLEIVRYEYDAANPAASVVKFNLENGVIRAISGRAAKEARENFRMNTPIAAIGVRGTDFVVSASQDTVRALVNEGTIVVAPYAMQCSADAFGPCQANSLELSGSDDQIVEVRINALNPVFLPAAGRLALPQAPAAPQLAVATAPQQESEEATANSVTSRAVNEKLTGSSVTTSETPAAITVPEFTPLAPVPPQALAASQLLWGRWSENGNKSNERISVSYDAATANNRKVTVGNDHYALFRIENGPNVVKNGLGVVGFALTQAQATFTEGGLASLMSVNKGQLSIDFEQRTFSTSLDLSHTATGAVKFADSGLLYSGGYFHSRSATQAMAGATSLDGAEAGYFFEKTLQNGYIEGLTLWGRQP